MTITTTQFGIMENAVNFVMENEDMELMFSNEETLYNELIESFELDVNSDNFEDEFECAIYTLEKVANNIVDMYDMNVFSELSDYYSFDKTLEILENEALVFYPEVYNMTELAENFLNDTDGIEYHIDNYLDEDALLHDLYCGGDIQDYYYNTIKEDALYNEGLDEDEAEKVASDYEITEEDERYYLEIIIDCAGKDFLSRYFDYEAFGRDMEIEGIFITTDSGIIEVTL